MNAILINVDGGYKKLDHIATLINAYSLVTSSFSGNFGNYISEYDSSSLSWTGSTFYSVGWGSSSLNSLPIFILESKKLGSAMGKGD